jgi:hypothetical protein
MPSGNWSKHWYKGEGARRLLAPSPPLIAAAAALFAADQYVYEQVGSSVLLQAPLDWTDHVLTTLFIVWAARPWFRERWLAPALTASVLIDADHIPGYLGWDILTAGTPRPYTHSLTTIGVLLAIAVLRRRGRHLRMGAAVGLCSHFWRDLAEPRGSGVSLLWPVTDHVFTIPASVYLGSVAAFALVAFGRSLSLNKERACLSANPRA